MELGSFIWYAGKNFRKSRISYPLGKKYLFFGKFCARAAWMTPCSVKFWLNFALMYQIRDFLTLFMLLMVSFYTPWKHKKTSGFRMFLGGIEKDQWHETSQNQNQLNCIFSVCVKMTHVESHLVFIC